MSHNNCSAKHLLILAALVVMLVLPLPLYAQEPDQVAVIRAMEEALNTGDVDAAMALFADDAVVTLAFFEETYTGAEEIRAWFEGLVAANFELQLEIVQLDGDTVITKTTTWIDFTREMGIAPLVAEEIYSFQNGKITGFTWTPTDETASKIQAAMATLPETGGIGFPGYLLVTAFGCLAILGGLGLALLRRRSSQGG
jgi:LPXTG-motif cell wall-anchored protein